jgi:hypothetical protein
LGWCEARYWPDTVAREGSFGGVPQYEQPISRIARELDSRVPDPPSARADPDFLYVVTVQVKQFASRKDLNDMLNRAMDPVESLE